MSQKTVLITGGTKGLGLATASAFAKQGPVHLLLTYRSDEASAKQAESLLEKLGASCATTACDLSEEGASEKLFQWVKNQTQSLDVYVHNAAATAFKPLAEIQSHHIDKTFNISVKSFILNVQQCVALMKNGGAIVTISGMDTFKAAPRHGLLGAAKSALETLTAYVAHEYAPQRIRCNCVNPGFIATDSTQKYLGPMFEKVAQAYAHLSPLKRQPTLDEVAQVVLFLASEQASWVVGQTINVDGGQDFAMPLLKV